MNGIKLAGLLWALAFFGAFAAAWIPNPLVGERALFRTNLAHDLVHLATALAFAGLALRSERATMRFLLAFGPIYALVGLLGFAVTRGGGHGMLLGFVCLNTADNFLHLALGGGIFGTWLLLRGPRVRGKDEGPLEVPGVAG